MPERPGPRTAAAVRPRVLLLVADAARQACLRRLLARQAPAARVDTEAEPLDALIAAAHLRADLVVIDAALPRGSAAALRRLIAGLLPRVSMLVFDEVVPAGDGVPQVWAWSAAEAVIRRSLERLCGAGA